MNATPTEKAGAKNRRSVLQLNGCGHIVVLKSTIDKPRIISAVPAIILNVFFIISILH
jgi:hypothetical protein